MSITYINRMNPHSTIKLKNLTQAVLAEKLGITDRAISKWERGKGY